MSENDKNIYPHLEILILRRQKNQVGIYEDKISYPHLSPPDVCLFLQENDKSIHTHLKKWLTLFTCPIVSHAPISFSTPPNIIALFRQWGSHPQGILKKN